MSSTTRPLLGTDMNPGGFMFGTHGRSEAIQRHEYPSDAKRCTMTVETVAVVVPLVALCVLYFMSTVGDMTLYSASAWAVFAVIYCCYLLWFRLQLSRVPDDDVLEIGSVRETLRAASRKPAFVVSVLVFLMTFCMGISHFIAWSYKSNPQDDLTTAVVSIPLALLAVAAIMSIVWRIPYETSVPQGSTCSKCCSVTGWVILGIVIALSTWNSIAYANGLRAYQHPGTLYTVQGHQMHMHCMGSGSPTVIFEHGWGSSSIAWAWIHPEVARVTRACVYDHSGYAWSQSGARPRTSEQIASELHDLLDAAGIVEPFVFVGHSFAGYNMRYFISRYPSRVVGMVMCDAVNPNSTKEEGFGLSFNCPLPFAISRYVVGYGLVRIAAPLTPEMRGILSALPEDSRSPYTESVVRGKYLQTRCEEWESWPVSTELVMEIEPKTLNFPLVVLSAGDGIYKDHQEYARELAALAPNSTFEILEGAEHSAVLADKKYADVVIRHTKDVIEQVRAR